MIDLIHRFKTQKLCEKKIIAGGAENICSYVVSKIGGTANKFCNFKLA